MTMLTTLLQRKIDLAEAELESNPDNSERDTGHDVMIEYSHGHDTFGHSEVPLFSGLRDQYKSLPRGPGLVSGVPMVPGRPYTGMATAAPILLSEPISPPKQFDSSYGSGLRVQPHSIPSHVREETY